MLRLFCMFGDRLPVSDGWLSAHLPIFYELHKKAAKSSTARFPSLPAPFLEQGDKARPLPCQRAASGLVKLHAGVLKSRRTPAALSFDQRQIFEGQKRHFLSLQQQKSGRYPKRPPDLEVTTRFELVNEGFADPCLTTWPRHHINKIPAAGRYLVVCGAADEARTRYLHLGKVALYQMSYGRKMCSLFKREHQRKWCLRSESNQ